MIAGERVAADERVAAREVDLVVLVNGFPRLSETFVLQELLDLERRGLRLMVFALSQPEEVVRQEAFAQLRARVQYVPAAVLLSRPRVARAHAMLAHRRGPRYIEALVRVRRSADATPSAIKRATVLARQIVERGSPPLYIHFAHKPGTVGRFAAQLAGVPYAISCHAKDIWLTPPEEMAPKLRDAELALTCTAAGKLELERHAAGRTPVRLVHHGTDVEAVVPRREPSGPPRVLSVGRLVEKKGYDTLIRAAAVLRDRDVAFELRIVGDGVLWPELQRLVHTLDLARQVTFMGPLSPQELHREWASAAVFALACRQLPNGDRDGLPNVVMEAMVQGLPVIGTMQPGIAEAVRHGHSGLLVAPDDPPALADALRRALAEPALARQLGARAQESVRERFDCRRLLPAVAAALADAGLIPPSEPATSSPAGAPAPALSRSAPPLVPLPARSATPSAPLTELGAV